MHVTYLCRAEGQFVLLPVVNLTDISGAKCHIAQLAAKIFLATVNGKNVTFHVWKSDTHFATELTQPAMAWNLCQIL